MRDIAAQALAVLLLSLRLAPMFAFAQPFTLMRVPALVRLILAITLAGWLVAGHPATTWQASFLDQGFVGAAASELLLGITLALALQLAFAAILTVGRAIDIQAGFGLGVLVDPTTRAQLPLAGTVFAYAAAMIFFALDGPANLLAVWDASVDQVPLGAGLIGRDPGPVIGFLGSALLLAVGLAGVVLLVLFIIDLAIAFLSRTLPQMNVLVVGFQVKAIATLATLPIAIGLGTALLARLVRSAIELMQQLV